jgi:hypothetical protein
MEKCTIVPNNIKKIPAQKWESTIAKGCVGFELLLMMFLATLDKSSSHQADFWLDTHERVGRQSRRHQHWLVLISTNNKI